MGLFRKTLSASTLGGVKYTSRREAETKERIANARLANAQSKQMKQEALTQSAAKWQQIVDAIEAGEASWEDLSRMQKLSMPIGFQIRCKAAERRRTAP